MVERLLSSNSEALKRYQKVGVVVFVLNKLGEVLLVRENSDKQVTGKTKGSFGVVCETSDEGETWEETVIRGLETELGIAPNQVGTLFKVDPNESFLGESLFVDGVLARVVAVRWVGEKSLSSFSGDGEISVMGWKNPGTLLYYPLRSGVRKILGECLDGKLLDRMGLTLQEGLLPLSVDSLRQAAEAVSASV